MYPKNEIHDHLFLRIFSVPNVPVVKFIAELSVATEMQHTAFDLRQVSVY